MIASANNAPQIGSRPLPEGSVLENIFFSLMAGHETLSNSLAFAVMLLAIHPEHQAKVHKELDRVLGDRPSNSWISESEYHGLNSGYLGAVLKEVLRMYNVVQFTFRITVAPTTVINSKGKSHTIPTSTTCPIDVAAAMQNPKVWKPLEVSDGRRGEPNHSPVVDFNTTRWLDDTNANEKCFPFGRGPWQCPGGFSNRGYIGTYFYEAALLGYGGDEEAAWLKTQADANGQMKYDVEFLTLMY
ncbi:cytochrome P450 [Phaeosphaeria sp. MPI-PUGE-AT-0046c]|nr:cytochrome P450 [Phaeosphaeria sp. MPI-PUGE-AT-0046c]